MPIGAKLRSNNQEAHPDLFRALSYLLLSFLFFAVFRSGIARPELWFYLALAGLALLPGEQELNKDVVIS